MEIADAAQRVCDFAVHFTSAQIDELGGEIGDQRLELETLPEVLRFQLLLLDHVHSAYYTPSVHRGIFAFPEAEVNVRPVVLHVKSRVRRAVPKSFSGHSPMVIPRNPTIVRRNLKVIAGEVLPEEINADNRAVHEQVQVESFQALALLELDAESAVACRDGRVLPYLKVDPSKMISASAEAPWRLT